MVAREGNKSTEVIWQIVYEVYTEEESRARTRAGTTTGSKLPGSVWLGVFLTLEQEDNCV